MTSPASKSIPLVVIGYARKKGEIFMPPLYDDTPYVMAACMDLVETKKPYQYTPHNLAVVLHNLFPRPRALVIGIAVDPTLSDDMERVWQEYVESVLKNESDGDSWKANAIVHLPKTHYVDPKVGLPPKDTGWETEMFRQLDSVFKPASDN